MVVFDNLGKNVKVKKAESGKPLSWETCKKVIRK